MPRSKELAQANLENVYRIFTVPEAPNSTLGRIDQAISKDLMGFLHDHIVAVERDLDEIEKDFSESRIPDTPTFVSITRNSQGKTGFPVSAYRLARLHRAHDFGPALLHDPAFPHPDCT
jgi:hypothetical protein